MTPSSPGPIAAWAWNESERVLQPPPPSALIESHPIAHLLETLEPLQRTSSVPPPALGSLARPALALCSLDPSGVSTPELQQAADRLRQSLAGERVTYVVNRNLNFTNHCVNHCGFCAFRRDPGSEGAFWNDLETLQAKAAEAHALGATELCLQGGLNPEARERGSALAYYTALLEALAEAAPGIHLHAFSPQELLFIAEQDDLPLDAVLEALEAAGLGSVPGTAAEVLTERVRVRLCPEKLTARQWCAVILQVHRRGLASTATLMAGHLESPADRVAHLFTLMALQRSAWQHGCRGFTEFVLLPFIGSGAPEQLRRRVGRDQPDLAAMLALTAQARLLLGGWVVNHQPSWVKLGLEGATEALRWGCNDLGGTLMEEHITTMAGATGGTSQTPDALEAAARSIGRPVRRRTTLYDAVPSLP